jgi:crotonobetainyl-CoA:carnitine CoA-transferase CaiB-like acyl-CoA transferase
VTATNGSEMTLPRQPFTLSRTPSKLMRRTPEFAEHTDELLAEFGFSGAEIKGFRERGSVE